MRLTLRLVFGLAAPLAWLASVVPASAGITPVAIRGIGGVDKVWFATTPALNEAGQVAFLEFVGNSPPVIRLWLWSDVSGLALVAEPGDPAPGAGAGVALGGLADPLLNDAGEIAFYASLSGSGVTSANNEAIFGPDGAGGFTLVARRGDPAPGTGAVFAGFFVFIGGSGVALNSLGEVAFIATLSGAGVGPGNDSAIFVWDAAGGLSLVIREGDPAPGLPAGITMGGLDLPKLSDSGVGLFSLLQGVGVTTSNDEAVWGPDGAGGLALVAREGDPAPGVAGATLGSILDVRMNSGGGLALRSFLGIPDGGIAPDDMAIFAPDGLGGIVPVARVGDPAPGTAESFTAFNPPVLNDAGEVAFSAATTWVSGHAGDPSGLWATDGSGGLRRVSPLGFEPLVMNDLGDVATYGALGPEDPVTLFVAPVSGGLVPVVVVGDGIEVAPGEFRTIGGPVVPPLIPAGGLFGTPCCTGILNDARQLLFVAAFEQDPVGPDTFMGSVLRADLFTDCVDALDNDGDGFANLADPGCTSEADPTERDRGQLCDDGIDNDGDGGVDTAGDPGCRFPSSPQEDPACQDGTDNDGQPGIDFDGGAFANGGVPLAAADPQCGSRPWWHTESASSVRCGLGGFEPALLVLAVGWLRARRRHPRP